MAYFAYNQPNNAFWQFIASMDDGFGDDRRPPSYAPRDAHERDQPRQGETSDAQQAKEKQKDKVASAEDEEMVDSEKPSDEAPRRRRHGRHGPHGGPHGGPRGWHHYGPPPFARGEKRGPRAENDESPSSASSDDEPRHRRHGPHGPHGGPRGWSHHGPPPPPPPFARGMFGFPGSGPDFGPDFGFDFSDWAGPHHGPRHHHGPPPPPPHDARGPPPPPPAGEGPPAPPPGEHPPPPPPFGHPPPFPGFGAEHHRGPHPFHEGRGRHEGFGGRGGRCGGRRGGGPGRGRPPFDVPAFLQHLGDRLGVDLNTAAANFGLDLNRAFAGGRGDADFIPPYDLFDLPSEYLLHVSLPGAKKADIGLDFDAESNNLRVGGVVHRPDVDEHITAALSHNGRRGQVGAFETKIPLPVSNDIIVEADTISAKLRDGVLVIHVSKVPKPKEGKKTIRIGTPSPSPEPETFTSHLPVREKEPVENNDMYETTPAPIESVTEKGDQEEQAMHEDPPEVLPEYSEKKGKNDAYETYNEEDDSQDGAADEGEYVKINVD